MCAFVYDISPNNNKQSLESHLLVFAAEESRHAKNVTSVSLDW